MSVYRTDIQLFPTDTHNLENQYYKQTMHKTVVIYIHFIITTIHLYRKYSYLHGTEKYTNYY
jgi:hypothetical protein